MRSVPQRKRMAILCVAVMLVGLAGGFAAPQSSYAVSDNFSDINGHWAKSKIQTAVSLGIVTGYQNGTFGPDKKVTRAEFVCMLNRALGNEGEATISFSDVKSGSWYYHDVAKAVNAAYAAGNTDGTFQPNKTITRQEAAFMISRVVPTYDDDKSIKSFSDYKSVSDWAYEAMEKMYGRGYISGYSDDRIHPLDALTRAQAVALVTNVYYEETIEEEDPEIEDDNKKLSGKIYPNDVTVTKDLDEGSLTISNCVILGTLEVKGGGVDTIQLLNSRVANIDVQKSSGPVRILAKGETSIAETNATKESILATSSLTDGVYGAGFEDINLAGGATTTLRGEFNDVYVNGSGTETTFESGSIENFIVTSAGKLCDISIDEDAEIETAVVNASANFYGEGDIGKMYINAKDVTYENEPKQVVIGAEGESPDTGTSIDGMTISPEKGETDVYIDTPIMITFESKMTNPKGKALSASKIDDIVTLTEGSATGTEVEFTATINEDVTVFTLTPGEPLEEKTKYYITVAPDLLMDADKVLNKAVSSYFTTGEDSEELEVTYYPATGATSVPLDEDSITISFSEKIMDADGGSLEIDENEYLLKKAVTFLKAGKAVDTDDYTVSLDSKRKKITIEPDNALTLNTSYTVGIIAGTLKTESDTAVPASTSVWTSAGTPTVSTLTATPAETSIAFTAKSSVKGTLYAVILPSSATAPTAANIKAGTDAAGAAALGSGSASVTVGGTGTISFSGLKTQTAYKIFAAVYDAQGNFSTVSSVASTTLSLLLSDLNIYPHGSGTNVLSSFDSGTKNYTKIYVPCGTDSVDVEAEANSDVFVGTLTINGASGTEAEVPLAADGTLTLTVVLQETGKTAVTYTVSIIEIGSVELASMTIDGDAYTPGDTYTLDTAATESVVLNIVPEDADADIYVDGTAISNSTNTTLNISATTTSVTFVIYSVEGQDSETYTIRFARP